MSREARHEVIPAILIASAMIVLIVNPVAAAESSGDDKWRFDLTVFLWLPKVDGTLGFDLPGSGDSLDLDPSTVIDNLRFGMLGFEARKNRWSAMADLIYLDVAEKATYSVPISIGRGFDPDVGANLELNGWMAEMAGAYDVIHTERANLGVLLGMRYLSLDVELDLLIDGPLPPELPTRYYPSRESCWTGSSASRATTGASGMCPITWIWGPEVPISLGRQ